MPPLIIAIDGPAGSGKSTLGRMLSRALSLLYIDTGSMYRAVALATIEANIDAQDREAVIKLAENLDVNLEGDPDSLRTLIGTRDVSELIRSEAVTEMSSIVSTIPGVRRAMVARQRELGRGGAVLNGRDITTVVFPDANYKFFLTASPTERAQRRFLEEQLNHSQASLAETLADMNERDHRDMTRADSPLKIADAAIVIDSTGKSIEQVFQEMMARIEEGPNPKGKDQQNVHRNH